MSGRHVDPTALDTQMPLGQTSSLPVLPYLIHLVRQYDRPAYEPLYLEEQNWRLIMRSK